MSLHEKSCEACHSTVKPLTELEAKEFLKQIPDWKLSADSKLIQREFKFKNFAKALEFVNRAGEIAEKEKHHPDIKLGWGYVNIDIQTHNINGLHQNDFILAAKIDKL